MRKEIIHNIADKITDCPKLWLIAEGRRASTVVDVTASHVPYCQGS